MRLLLLFLLAFALSACGANKVSVTDYLSGDFTGCGVGAFVNGLGNLNDFQTRIDKNLAVVHWYVHWQDEFPSAEADSVEANGSLPLITWEPAITNSLGTLEAIATGSYESYVRGFIQAAKNWGKPIFLRFAHEMNGNWYGWDGSNNGGSNGPAVYKRAWSYIYSVREALGASNVYLVWSVNNTNVPAVSWNSAEAYYPGDQYVDWVAIDGYNWGTDSGTAWQTFSQVFADQYQTVTALTDKPLMIAEFAAAETGGSKVAWITDAFSQIKNNYPRIKLVCWFNINKERDWRINSSATAEAAVKSSLRDCYFLATIK